MLVYYVYTKLSPNIYNSSLFNYYYYTYNALLYGLSKFKPTLAIN